MISHYVYARIHLEKKLKKNRKHFWSQEIQSRDAESIITKRSFDKAYQGSDIFKLDNAIQPSSILFVRGTPTAQLYERTESKIMGQITTMASNEQEKAGAAPSVSGRMLRVFKDTLFQTKVLVGTEQAEITDKGVSLCVCVCKPNRADKLASK